jgi:hypothetical protein
MLYLSHNAISIEKFMSRLAASERTCNTLRHLKIFTVSLCYLAGSAFAAPGELDSTFGSSGKTLHNVSGLYDEATHIVQQSDAKLLVAGYSVTPIEYGFVSRYTSNGNVDQSFGVAGIASLSAGVNPLAISTLPGGDFLITSPGQLRRFTSDG